MAQGDDEQHDPLQSAGSLYDDNMEDSTMEISLQDIYALSQVDQQTAPSGHAASSSGSLLHTMAPPPAPLGDAPTHDPLTVEIDEDLIELDDQVLSELTSEVFDEQDYDLVQKNFDEIDGLVEPTLFPDDSHGEDEEFANTGVLTQSYDELINEQLSLEDDTDPSMDLYLPELSDPISLAQEDPSEAFDSMEELSHEQFSGHVEEPEESWVDSTSVFSPDAALLQAARGAFAASVQESTEHMIEVPILELLPDESIEQDATGMFEVPAALLSQLRQTSEDDLPPAALPHADDGATIQGAVETTSVAVPPFEVDAHINAHGLVVIPEGQAMTGHLRPGMRLRLLVQILHD
jgi:hypothetical protein